MFFPVNFFFSSRENFWISARENVNLPVKMSWKLPVKTKKVPVKFFAKCLPWKQKIVGVKKMKISNREKHKSAREKKYREISWNLRRKHTYHEICDDHLSKRNHTWFLIDFRTLELKINHLFLIWILNTINLPRVGSDFFNHDCKTTDFSFTKIGRSVDICIQ